MAWRIADYIERGEIDNRTRDRVRGQLWLHGVEQPIQLELAGNSHRDLAGQLLRFKNPKSQALPPHLRGFASEQMGVVGDMTASRKVKISISLMGIWNTTTRIKSRCRTTGRIRSIWNGTVLSMAVWLLKVRTIY